MNSPVSRPKLNLAIVISEQVGLRVMNLATFAIMARYVDAKEVGILGLAWTVVFFFEALTVTALIPAYLQNRRSDILIRSTFFWICSIAGLVSGLIMLIAAFAIPGIRETPHLPGVISAVALIFAVRMLGTAHQSVLLKDQQQGFVAARTTVSAVIGSVVGICLAVSGFGVWSLLLRDIISSVIDAAGSLLYRRWIPVMRINRKMAKEMIRFSRSLVITQFGKMFIITAQKFVVLNSLGLSAVGRLEIARKIPDTGYQMVAAVNERFLLPFAAAKNRKEKGLHKLYLQLSAAATVAVAIGLAITFPLKEWIITLAFGKQWAGSGMLFFLVLAGTSVTLVKSIQEILLTAAGAPHLSLIGLWWMIGSFPFFYLGSLVNLETACLTLAVCQTLSLIHFFFIGNSHFSSQPDEFHEQPNLPEHLT